MTFVREFNLKKKNLINQGKYFLPFLKSVEAAYNFFPSLLFYFGGNRKLPFSLITTMMSFPKGNYIGLEQRNLCYILTYRTQFWDFFSSLLRKIKSEHVDTR